MQTFRFSARAAGGALETGQLSASSSRAAAAELAGRGLVPLHIEAAPAAAAGASSGDGTLASVAVLPPLGSWWPGGRRGATGVSSLRHRAKSPRTQQALGFVLREVSALLKAGVPILRALRLSEDACHDPQVKGLLDRLATSLDGGRDLSSAAASEVTGSGLFTDYDVAMLRVGESTGRLTESFHALHLHREFMRTTREQVVSAVRYPVFVIGTCVLAMVIVNLFVIPQFARVFRNLNAELPVLTRLLMFTSETIQQGWPAMLAAVVAGGFAFKRWTGTSAGRLSWDRLLLRTPLVGGILNGIVMTRFARSFSSSFKAGLTVTQALDITAQTLGNAHVEQRVRGMLVDLERGASIAAAARQAGVFPTTLLQIITIGEETGSLEELLGEMATHYETEVSYSIARLSAAIEPLLIWFLGMGVLVLALGVFMPMWELGRASIK